MMIMARRRTLRAGFIIREYIYVYTIIEQCCTRVCRFRAHTHTYIHYTHIHTHTQLHNIITKQSLLQALSWPKSIYATRIRDRSKRQYYTVEYRYDDRPLSVITRLQCNHAGEKNM